MARMKYLGPVDPLRVPGIGPVGEAWVVVPDHVAREFEHDKDFQIEFDPVPNSELKTKNSKLSRGGDK
jgi:hypothetical protein